MNINEEIDSFQISPLALIRWVNSEYERQITIRTSNNKILNQRAVRSILKILSMNNGISQNELAREIHLKGSTVSVALIQMEEHGLINRSDSQSDKRKINVYLTAKGYDLKKQLDGIVEQTEEKMLSALTENQRYELHSSLSIILKNCK